MNPYQCANTYANHANAAAPPQPADGNMKQTGQLRTARRESCSAFLCLPVPHEDLPRARASIPVDTMSVYSNKVTCPLLLHTHTYFDLDFHLPKKQSMEEEKN